MTGIIVKVLIEHKGKILLLQRSSKDTHKPSIWELPGGNAELNETLDATAIRETKEETGLDIILVQLISSCIFKGDREHCVRVTYLAKTKTTDVKISSEHDAFEWQDVNEEFPQRVQPEIDLLLKNNLI